MILIQRFKKIKQSCKTRLFREILLDLVFYVFFFLVGSSFVFYRLEKGREKPFVLYSEPRSFEATSKSENQNSDKDNHVDKKYVASSRGTYYYAIGSSRANSLSEKNKIYFYTPEEAEKLGFKPYYGN